MKLQNFVLLWSYCPQALTCTARRPYLYLYLLFDLTCSCLTVWRNQIVLFDENDQYTTHHTTYTSWRFVSVLPRSQMVKAIYYTRDTEKKSIIAKWHYFRKILEHFNWKPFGGGTTVCKRITCHFQNHWLTPSFKVWPIIVTRLKRLYGTLIVSWKTRASLVRNWNGG